MKFRYLERVSRARIIKLNLLKFQARIISTLKLIIIVIGRSGTAGEFLEHLPSRDSLSAGESSHEICP